MQGRFHLLAGLALAFTLSSPALASIQYNSNNPTTGFDATTAGTVPAGWTSGTGAWQALATGVPVPSHTHIFGDSSQTNNAIAVYTGGALAADLEVTSTQTVTLSGGNATMEGLGARYNAAGNTGYVCAAAVGGGNAMAYIFKQVAGAFTLLSSGSPGAAYSPASGSYMGMRVSVVGTTISCRIWDSGSAEPSAWTVQITDGSITGTGYAAISNGQEVAGQQGGITDLTVNDVPYGETNAIGVTTPGPIAVGATVSGLYTGTAPAGLGIALDGATSFTAVSGPTISGGIFSFALPSMSAGYHQMTIQATNLPTEISATSAFNSIGVGPATAYSLTGPENGSLGSASTNFTATSNGTLASSVTVTPSDSSGGGTFAPTTISLGVGTGTSATFTYTAGSAGAKTISTTNSSTLTNPSSIIYTATSNVAIAPNNAAIYYSPYNWAPPTSSAASTINPGAYFKTLFSGSSLTLNFNITNNSAPISQIYYRIDGYENQTPWKAASVASTIAVTMPTLTTAFPYHLLEVMVKSTSETINRWNSPFNTAVVFTGLTLAPNAIVLAPQTYPQTCLFYGDSRMEGVRTVNYTSTNDTDRNDALAEWPWQVAQHLNCEFGIVGFGGQGVTITGSGNVPPLLSSYNLIMAGVSRSFSPAPGLIAIMDVGNDYENTVSATTVQTAMTTVLNSLISATPSTTKIAVLQDFIAAAYPTNLQAAVAAVGSSRVTYVPTPSFFNTTYGADNLNLHPTAPNAVALIAPQIAAALQPILYPFSGGGSPAANIGGVGLNVP